MDQSKYLIHLQHHLMLGCGCVSGLIVASGPARSSKVTCVASRYYISTMNTTSSATPQAMRTREFSDWDGDKLVKRKSCKEIRATRDDSLF
eukprot:300389-Amphidinium_carterae.1